MRKKTVFCSWHGCAVAYLDDGEHVEFGEISKLVTNALLRDFFDNEDVDEDDRLCRAIERYAIAQAHNERLLFLATEGYMPVIDVFNKLPIVSGIAEMIVLKRAYIPIEWVKEYCSLVGIWSYDAEFD